MTDRVRDLLSAAAGARVSPDLDDIRRRARRHILRRRAAHTLSVSIAGAVAGVVVASTLGSPAVSLLPGPPAGGQPSTGPAAPSLAAPGGVVGVPGGPAQGAGPGRPLDDDLLALLRTSGLEVQVPRTLPEWARDQVPEVAAGPGLTRLTWRRALGGGDQPAAEPGADLALEVTAELSSAEPAGEVDIDTPRRTYRMTARCPAGDRASWSDGDVVTTVALTPSWCDAPGIAPHDVLLVADSLAPAGQDPSLGAEVADAALATAPDGFDIEQLEGSESPQGPPFGDIRHLLLGRPDGTTAQLAPGTTALGPGGGHYLDQLDRIEVSERHLGDGRPVASTATSGGSYELTFRAGDRLILLSVQGPYRTEGGEVVPPSLDVVGGLAWADRIVDAVD